MVSLELKDQMNTTTAPVDHGVNELELAGLSAVPATIVAPPLVKQAPIHFECRLHREIILPCTQEDSINTMITGEVLGIHIKDEVLTDGLIDLNKIRPLARLGYQQYTAVDNIFKMVRPNIGAPG